LQKVSRFLWCLPWWLNDNMAFLNSLTYFILQLCGIIVFLTCADKDAY
jgi:hypothetical protein